MPDELNRLKAALTDKYAIERELGRGGMATVYLAEDLKHKRKVAVKVLRPDLAATLGPERFLREIEVAAKRRDVRLLDGPRTYLEMTVELDSTQPDKYDHKTPSDKRTEC